MIHDFLAWVDETTWSTRLLESFYLWPWIESTHVLTIMLFVGTTMMMDLRLLGVSFRGVPASEFTGRMLPWTRAGFYVSVVTGLLLVYSDPLRYYHNLFFRVKMVVFLLAGLNVWLFHSRIHERVDEWDLDSPPPLAARVAGGVSLAAWVIVVVADRMIAYNWFDCDIQPQPDLVNLLAGCSAMPEGR